MDRVNFNKMKEYTGLVDHTREVITLLEKLSDHFKSAQIYTPSYNKMPEKNYYLLYKKEADSVQKEILELQKLVKDDSAQVSRLNLISTLIQADLPLLMQKNVTEIIQAGEAWRLNKFFKIHNEINKAIAEEDSLLAIRKAEQERSTNASSSLTIIFSIAALVILLATFVWNLFLMQKRKRLESFLESVLNTTQNGIISYKAVRENGKIIDFKVEFANKAIQRLIGLNPKELIGKRVSHVSPFIKQSGFFEKYVHVVETGEQEEFENVYENGTLKSFLYVILSKRDDGLVASFYDIAQSKRDKQAIEQSANYLQQIIDSSQTGMFLFSPVRDENGQIIDFKFTISNKTADLYASNTGYNNSIKGLLASEVFPDYKTNGMFDRYKETCETGKTNRFDFHYPTNNNEVWLDIMATRLGDDVLITFADYSPLKKLQQQLELSVLELKRSNNRLSEFAYVASHDLQEPLRKVMIFSNFLKEKSKDNLTEESSMYIDRIQNATQRMQAFIDDLLTYSQVSKKAEEFQQVDLNKLVKEVLTDLDFTIHEKKAVITLGELNAINGDKTQLHQLFLNLISNALKFHQPKQPPHITISASIVKSSDLKIESLVKGPRKKFYVVEVADKGIGFDPEFADRIFHLFQRLHGKKEYAGTGIGLSIAQKVMENHNGYIYAESEKDKGSVFKLLFPVS